MRRRRFDEELEAGLAEAEQARDLARTDRDRLVHALAGAPVALVVVDAGGEEVLRSDAAERFRENRVGEAVAVEVIKRLLKGALDGEEAEEEVALFGPPRENLVVRAVPLRGGDHVIGAAAYVDDISELRRVDRVRRDFVANVSHELKTPIGAMGLLAETFLGCDDPEVGRRMAEQLVREADRLSRIVDDLLDLSQVESEGAPEREPVVVRELVEEAVGRVAPFAAAQGIPLEVAPIPGGLSVACDRVQVLGALTNLLDNAIKYSDPGEPVEVSAGTSGATLVVRVVDHGIGIPSRSLERVFERFYRVDPARSRATGGTGLGLSIVRHVAQAHGGDVTVESIEGAGSTFSLILPGILPGAEDAA